MDSQAFWAEAERCRALARSPLTRGKAKRKLAELCRAQDGDLATRTEVAGLPITLDLSRAPTAPSTCSARAIRAASP
jgi:hypothetical protein